MHKSGSDGKFTSSIGFVLAAVGSAVGMANIWLFPYRVGQYGGGAFLIPYFLFVALFSYVGLSGEFAFGRLTGTGARGSFDYAMKSRGWKGGSILGILPLLGVLGIAIGYSVVVGWVLRYAAGSLTGSLLSSQPDAYFEQLAVSFGSIPWHFIVIAATVVILVLGVTAGIEKISKFMMPAFYVFFLVIAVRVAFLPGAVEGYRYLLEPDWSYLLKFETWVMAMGQAFFSLSITGSGMIVYGAYLGKEADIPQASLRTAFFDTIAALLSGLAIMPAVFAFGVDVTRGPSLMFIALPTVFQRMPLGRVFAVFFFISVAFAGITSLINMFEAVIESWQNRFQLDRRIAVALCGGLTFGVGVFLEAEPVVGSWLDFVTIVIVPIGAVLGAISIYYVLGWPRIRQELETGRGKPLPELFGKVAKYVYVPLTVLVLLLGFAYGGIG